MKKIISFTALFALLLLWGCSKETPGSNNDNNVVLVRYQFTATLAGNYTFKTVTDTVMFSETVNTASWTKTETVKGNAANASFTVYQPADWYGTSNETDVTLKIFINDVEKASGTAHLVGVDRPGGYTITATGN